MSALPSSLLAILGVGPTELIVVLVILLFLFGGAKLPGLARGLGKSISEFKKASKEGAEEDEKPLAPKSAEHKTHGPN
jgi:sec-independent protein translocase protein TatA